MQLIDVTLLTFKSGPNIIKANKSESVEVDVCGPFMNSKTGQGSYIVIFGVLKKGWTLKALFIRGYVGTLVERMNPTKNTSINVEHCETYYEFNIIKLNSEMKVRGCVCHQKMENLETQLKG